MTGPIFGRYLRDLVFASCGSIFILVGVASGSAVKTKVTFWHTTREALVQTNIDEIVEAFNNSQSDIQVVNQVVPGSSVADVTNLTKLIVAVASGTGPDLFLLDRFTVQERASQFLLEDLTSIIAENAPALEQSLLPFAWDEVVYQGKIFGVPTNTDTRVLYFRPDILERAGIEVNEVLNKDRPLTLKAFLEIAARLDKRNSRGDWESLGFVPWAGQGNSFTWTTLYGGDLFDKSRCEITPDHPGVVAGHEFIANYIESRGGDRLRKFVGKIMPENVNIRSHPFITGKLPFMIEGSWYESMARDAAPKAKFAKTYLPTHNGQPISWSGGWSIVMPKGVKNKEAAFKFLQYFTGKEGQAHQLKIGLLPTLKSLLEGSSDFFMRSLGNSISRPPSPMGATIWKEMMDIQQGIIAGTINTEGILPRLKATKETLNKKMHRYCQHSDKK